MITWLNIQVAVTAVWIDENPYPQEPPAAMASRLAYLKAQAVRDLPDGAWVIAADTIVDFNTVPLGKPQSPEEACVMLQYLRQNRHQVHTGLALFQSSTGTGQTCRVTTDVWMRDYTDAEIATYVTSGDPMDKAGAYAIQNVAFHPVARLDRCYANVVGLPLCAVARLLATYHYPMPKLELSRIPELCYQHFGYRCPSPDQGVCI
ncbi:MAG: septum formation protein Maf [Anaerolineae bacterium]|nr:septum formation protein Maf [Anaerolineae bacterium]